MLYGVPGTGKTSLFKGLATHFGLDMWYIALGDLKDESNLMGLISEVQPRSMLLLEDIDTVRISHERNQDGPGITMSSLINALDGVATPHGLISCMTTNHFDVLDPALIRAGRMDLIEEIGLPGPNEIAGMFQHFYGQAPLNGINVPGLSQAEIAEVFKRHFDDYEGALMELKAMAV
jgi:chaperone BCS1